MVSEPTVPAPHTPPRLAPGPLIEASFRLWQRSWAQTFWFGVLYGIASLLPGVLLAGLTREVMMHSVAIIVDMAPAKPAWAALLPSSDPMALVERVLGQLRDPMLWLVVGASAVLVVYATTALLVRQAGIERNADAGLRGSVLVGLRRTPATLLAWLLYTAIVLATAIPFFFLTFGALWFSLGATPSVVLMLLVVILFGGLLSSVPLAWASIAFGFSPFVTALEDHGPLRAQGRSMRLVRGHWWRSAMVVSMPLLICIGIVSTVSSLLMLLCGTVAYLWGGWVALFDPGWLFWSQLLGVPLQAPALTLAFAGGVVMFDDLRLRAPGAA